ncbi:MAG: hypothetical protein ACREEE_03340 [Dongiaceae bacterium]
MLIGDAPVQAPAASPAAVQLPPAAEVADQAPAASGAQTKRDGFAAFQNSSSIYAPTPVIIS